MGSTRYQGEGRSAQTRFRVQNALPTLVSTKQQPGADQVTLLWWSIHHVARARVVAEGVGSLDRRLQRRNAETRAWVEQRGQGDRRKFSPPT